MNEVKVYAALLAVLMVGSYFSFTREEPAPGSVEKVTILDVPKGGLTGLTLFGKSSTVTVTFKKDNDGKEYGWFVVEQNKKKRPFVGNDKVDKMIEGFTPFTGLRSLGKLTGEELEETKLEKPDKKLVLHTKGGDKIFSVGGRSAGARDYYVRPAGSVEVFLVASAVVGDLEFPEGRFMQRKLREQALKDVSQVSITANGKAKTILHRNRLSPNDSYWATEQKPDEKSETLGNYADKLDKLSALEYAPEDQPYPSEGTPVLTATWYGEDEKTVLSSVEIWRVGADKTAEYYARSTATKVPVKLSRFSADQLERDLATVMAD